MRTNGTLNYLLGDHLGSTSLVTDSSGAVISQQYYKAWGEVRYASGNTPTKYTFTGQYSYTSDFGLMFYNARWVDVSLGRFAQADSIVPGGIQGLDRYAYVGNDPIKYSDPSGRCRMDASMDDCYSIKNLQRAQDLIQKAKDNPGKKAYGRYALNAIANLYGIKLSPSDHWEYEPFMVEMYGTPRDLGTTPRSADEIYYGYNPENPVADARYIADDYGVYITGDAFDYCELKLSCIASVMAHEAVHSWVEYLIGGSDPASVTPETVANEELFADNIGIEVLPIGTTHFKRHEAGVLYTCDLLKYNCSSPQNTLENTLNVDLSTVADLVIP